MRLVKVVLAALLCIGLYPSLASAQDEAFKKGVQARGDKNWTEAARQLRSAIVSDGQESTRKVRGGIVGVFGGGGVEYLPHYFLGEALKNQGDCSGAVTEWATSLDQKVVQSKAEFVALIRKGFQECGAKGVLVPGDFEAQLKVSRQAYIDANAYAKKIIDLGTSHRDQWLPLSAQYDDPHKELKNASTRLNAAMKSRLVSDFAEVKAASDRAVAKLKPLEEALNTAIENLASIQQKIVDVQKAIDGAESADKAIDSVKATLTEPMAAIRKTGRDQLAQARTQLTAAQKTQNPATVSEALKYAQSATASFTQVGDQLRKIARTVLDQQLSEAVRVADEAFLAVSALMETMNRRAAQKPDKVTPEITSQRDALQKRVDAQRSRYDRARKAEDLPGLADVAKQTLEAQSALDQLIQAFGPLTLGDRGVHAALQEGTRLYFEGDYEKALAALDPSTGVEDAPTMQLHVHLFRAASLFGLYVRSGEKKQELRSQALGEIERCKQINSTFEPDARFFPPRLLTLYRTGGAAAQAAAPSKPQ
jgi:hypothetical protein